MAKLLIGKHEASIYREGNGWTGAISLGFKPNGKRNRIKRKGRTKEEVKAKLREVADELEKGIKTEANYTVADCVNDFITHGLQGRAENTRRLYRSLADNRIIPSIGRVKLKELTADHVETMLEGMVNTHSTGTIRHTQSLLKRAIRMAERRDKVGRNVAALIDPPKGCKGRPSKSLNLEQALRLVTTAQQQEWRFGAYTILCLMSGIRTEEARTLRWSDVDLDTGTIYVLRAARHGGDTKTPKSRRGLSIGRIAVAALSAHKARQAEERLAIGEMWQDNDLVFCRPDGRMYTAHDVRRGFQKITEAAGLGREWAPRELRHTFVSLLSDHEIPIEKIADLVGHSSTNITETVYRHQLKPVLKGGAEVMDEIFRTVSEKTGSQSV